MDEWPKLTKQLAPHIATMAAGSGGRYAPDDIVSAIDNGEFQVWLAYDGDDIACVVLTSLINYPQFKALRLIACVGTGLPRWVGLLVWLEDQARGMGCSRMEALSPGDYVPLLVSRGWAVFHVLTEKSLCAA